MTRIFLSAGESSGDMHGAELVAGLRRADPSVVCEGLGGPRMAAAGMDLHFDLASQGIMGFVEVVKRFGMMRRLFLTTVKRLEVARPDCVVLIDYPGFHLQLAKRVKRMGIPIVYYIGPQVWAWKKGRIYTIAELVDKMLVILPFEEALYRDVGVDCSYVGHPLLDQVAAFKPTGAFRDGLVIGLLPGSREQEIERLLATMIEVARGIRERYPEARFVTPCVDRQREAQVRAIAGDFPLETAIGRTYELLDGARFCMVASGTATLEAALFGVPMVIMYKVAWLSYWLARLLVHIEHIGLVNILAGKRVVPEFIQGAAKAAAMLPVALELIEDGPARETMLEELAAVRDALGEGGASAHAAGAVLDVVQKGAGRG
ncbi:MAG: lipid-A-disaccharide synthase [Candidatus Hydrogenedentes bacterium]|nr:lipid-A-disaccharide synthase [Candidatus Hydrogenedentota bacterium]